MIDLYTWSTPNGRKISVMLEELETPYKVIAVDINNDEQFSPEFLAVCPNSKIPAIVDRDAEGGPLSIFESGAILIYLGEKYGRFYPAAGAARSDTLQWLMYQMSHVGPMLGQLNHFINQAPEGSSQYAIERFMNESLRILGVLDGALADNEFLAGDYSIADMATYPWVAAAWEPFSAMLPDKVAEMANVGRWIATMAARPAVARGMAVPE